MAEPTQLCVEDTCRLRTKKWLIGVVDRTFHDVDSHEPDPQREYNLKIERHKDVSEADFERFLRSGIPPQGTVLVSWQTDFTTELLPTAELEILDRSFFVGDVVKRSARSHMSGTVIGTRLECSVAPVRMWPSVEDIRASQAYHTQVGDDTGRILADVPAEEIDTVRQYPEGCLVIYDNWIGRVDDTYDEVSVRLSNGTVVVVENEDELVPVDPRLERHEIGDFVRTKKGNLRRGRWLFGAFSPNVEPNGVVVDVRTVSISVAWLSRRLGGPAAMPGAFPSEPPAELGLDELDSGRVHVYDNMRRPPQGAPAQAASVSRTSRDLTAGQRVRFNDLAGACVKYNYTKKQRTETLGFDTNVFTVQDTRTTAVVQWQDLSITEDAATNLLPDPNVDDEDEVWPGEIIITNEKKPRASAPDGEAEPTAWYTEPAKVGVVQTVDGLNRMATVRWFPDASVKFMENDLLPGSETGVASGPEEKVSLYDIRTTTSLNRRRGDYVVVLDNALPGQGSSDDADNPVDWFGEIVDLGLDGLLTVRLGAAEPVRDIKVPVERVILAYSTDIDEHMDHDHEMDDVSDGEFMDDEDMEELGDDGPFVEMWYEYPGQDGERVLAEGNDEDEAWATDDEDEEDASSAEGDVTMADAAPGGIDTSKTTPEAQPEEQQAKAPAVEHPDAEAARANNKAEPQSFSEYPDAPEQFAILESTPPQDHRYINSHSDTSQARMRRIQKEHKILRTSLPPGIFVRTWESRLDLLRVLIIGPVDTPYEYAPFIVDFHLGSNFPNTAPDAFFHSWTNGFGPVNPNLYEDGKICLSLLGTWHADESNENWSPGKSTILQVLVSLLGLVLVKEPYYNEAGYEVRHGTEESALPSALYSEKAYFRARGFIMHGLSQVPAPFEAEMDWLYHGASGPRLLHKAIDAAKDIIERSKDGGGSEAEKDGIRRISAGAVIPLKRQLDALEGLKRGGGGDGGEGA
ncbi:uncharacterized protein K452DRAFT_256175 [Aplosporella prunicola CBS 121167]|uniref:UBC core domain-containing protein n=1 Tax=Aplosporella prunicola CBS 121167 TaxID=1176127 RepID=A0A6A6B4K8_9PEZI|nr:uncharacterized protein K452DRAFT_256175 [Aplosporella prunicola CBS 121167]KAF2138568.1 hypothetical protein K452DRAFT_256175 [Aplosporella prunicola CBS 121167]